MAFCHTLTTRKDDMTLNIPIREGKPGKCIACGNALHRKSEYYCSKTCYDAYHANTEQEKPPFLSKWKIRKRKEARDPSVALRKKTRLKTNTLIRQGKLSRKPCVVCHSRHVIPHHEDYSNPSYVIWLCEEHHVAYHNGEIALFKGELRWNPDRLLPKGSKHRVPKKKYQKLQQDYQKNTKKKEM
jgi:hypothetical protein